MSEQTPDTNSGVSDGQDPSMEDILASIRKIIAEDDAQPSETLDANIDILDADALKGDVAELAQVESLDLDILEDLSAPLTTEAMAAETLAPISEMAPAAEMADIDALIGDMDEWGAEGNAVPAVDALPDTNSDDVLDLMIPMEDAEIAMDESAELTLEVDTSDAADDVLTDVEAVAAPEAEMPDAEISGDEVHGDDLALMLDNMLEDSQPTEDDGIFETVDLLAEDPDIEENGIEDILAEDNEAETPAIEEQLIDPTEDLLDDIDLTFDDEASAEASQTDPDIDLVKSLMADLTEEPLHDNSAENLEDIAAIDIDDVDEPEGDVMDEILSMTFDDETKLSEELEIPPLTSEPIIEDVPVEALSLKDIAAQATADAESSGPGLMTGAAALAGLGAVGAAVTAQDDNVEPESGDVPKLDDVDDILADFDELLAPDADLDLTPDEPVNPDPEPLIEETPDMARAKKTDAIIDDVTETATAGAFASLSNVVEEKAVVAERGDRVGDLVMEALRPMLKEWLDANLKGIVERAVTKEVKRISSGK